ncbi:MAG: septal ring lytic transglycosylase RlpA family protein [Terriglobales bacterium]
MRRTLCILALGAVLALVPAVHSRSDQVLAAPPPPYQIGLASWYGPGFQGRTTSSGTPFNMMALTAAHRQLPLGTRVVVTDLCNGRSVVVLINDRGPVPRSRVIDLSYEAAHVLQFNEAGLAPVSIRILAPDAHVDPQALVEPPVQPNSPHPAAYASLRPPGSLGE